MGDEDEAIAVDDITAELLADGVVLVRYRSTAGASHTQRSSIWVRSSIGWRVRYHQGTLIA
jgi:ribonuclease HI